MNNKNRCDFTGHLTRDPEVKVLPGGSTVANFSLAVNKSWKDKGTDEWKEKVIFVEFRAWNGLGEMIGRNWKKGDYVSVDTEFAPDSWEAEDGTKRTAARFTVKGHVEKFNWTNKQENSETTEEKPSTPKRGRKPKAESVKSEINNDDSNEVEDLDIPF